MPRRTLLIALAALLLVAFPTAPAVAGQRAGATPLSAPAGEAVPGDDASVRPAPSPPETVRPTPRSQRREGGRTGATAPKRRPRRPGKRPAPGAPAPPSPVLAPPSPALASPSPALARVPEAFIDGFRIPPFLLPIYQAAGTEYGVRWEVLAAINEIETDYGRNLGVSSAGAVGWMQFLPASWQAFGVDANRDGSADPSNPADAIFAAARYLKAAGAEHDLRGAIFAYNHADWYVEDVLARARTIGGLPANLLGALTGLAEGRFPVPGRTTFAPVSDQASTPGGRPRSTRVRARRGARVVAATDGRVVRVGRTRRLGRFVALQDAYGTTFTYAHLARVARTYPAPRPAPAGRSARGGAPGAPRPGGAVKERLYAHPERSPARQAGLAAGPVSPGDLARLGLRREDVVLRRLARGARVVAGTVLGRLGGATSARAPHLLFELRPAGRGAPRIDPRPVLEGWKLLDAAAQHRARSADPFAAPPSVGQLLLMDKRTLVARVLADPRIELYACGRRDVRAGEVDRRVLAALEFLAASGLRPTVTSLKCGHSYLTKSGRVSHHSSGTAVDIAALNGVPVLGHQGPGSITELAVQRLLTLQGPLAPAQVISLMAFEGAPSTLAMADHADHLHLGWRPVAGTGAEPADALLEPEQWTRLIDRLESIENPSVRLEPSKHALKVTTPASRGPSGE